MLSDKAAIEAMARALERSVVALDDWLTLYADDVCDPAHVAESRQRVGQVGTIGYISEVQRQNWAALAALREMEGRDG